MRDSDESEGADSDESDNFMKFGKVARPFRGKGSGGVEPPVST